MYLGAEYETPNRSFNEVSLWDRIIERKEDAVIIQPYVRNKYKLTDEGHHLRGLKFNLTLHWDVVPTVGKMRSGERRFEGFQLPVLFNDSFISP